MSREIETLAEFAEVLEASSLAGCVVQSLDLAAHDAALAVTEVTGASFLGCRFSPGRAEDLARRGALVFPALPEVPFDPYRAHLYAAPDLYDAPAYADCFDARVYAWSRAAGTPPTAADSLAMALHDHAMTDALDELALPGPVVGIMGGHALGRDTTTYADAARLAQHLAEAGLTILTGGGPGAMEAANLGAWFAGRDGLSEALDVLATVPTFRPSIDDWVARARAVRERWPAPAALSLAIPTWFYGHEPPNAFASHIAKYFANALREDTLLARCDGGIVFLPGAAGTVQEIFQAITPRFYAPAGSPISPLVFVGRQQWTQTIPVWPAVSALAAGRPLADHIHLVDSLDEVAQVLQASVR